MFESALEAGFVASGVNVLLIGPLPTPGIAYMTRSFKCRLRHRHQRLAQPLRRQRHQVLRPQRREALGRARGAHRGGARAARRRPARPAASGEPRASTARASHYQEFCASTLPHGVDLAGLKIVIDCANGAAYKVGPRVLADLGAEIVPIGCSPNGRNINDGCGSTAPRAAAADRAGRARRRRHRARRRRRPPRDGRSPGPDGRRRPAALHHCAGPPAAAARLRGPVVGTVMSNLGLELALRAERHRVPARAGRRPLRARPAARDRRHPGRRDLRTHHLPGPDDDRRRHRQRPAGARRHEADRASSLAELASGMRKFPQVLLNVKVAAPLRSGAGAGGARGGAAHRAAHGRARAGWCCAPRAPSR